ncbi:hypothetical protein D3C76_1734310 [compost metagenome]
MPGTPSSGLTNETMVFPAILKASTALAVVEVADRTAGTPLLSPPAIVFRPEIASVKQPKAPFMKRIRSPDCRSLTAA